MIRVRLHGRGGQGMKTASRVLGTAAALAGFEAQDSPVYGAERRGAPVAAFVRFAQERIAERGVIARPDLVVLADESLLDDTAAAPCAGLPPTGALLLSTPRTADQVRRHTGHPGPIVARDFAALAPERLGGTATALAAAAGALLALPARAIDQALAAELGALGVGPAVIESSLALAGRARTGLEALAVPVPAGPRTPGPPVVELRDAGPWRGTPGIVAPANTPGRRTGSWRLHRPLIDLARCTRCWVCFVRCPDGAISLDGDARPWIDYAVCKGCLICAEECPTHAVTHIREQRTWLAAERPA